MPQATPNLLVILSDQLRRDALSVHGDPNIQTPNIDELAHEGVRFDAACSTCPICVPFRFTMMTGHRAHTRLVPGIGYRMSPAERTLADAFNEADCETIYVGKWHLYGEADAVVHRDRKSVRHNGVVPRSHQGRWQTWRGFELHNAHFDGYITRDDDPAPEPLEGFQTDALFDLTMEHLAKRRDDRPFCCVLSVEPPHPPYEAPEELARQWRGREIKLPPDFYHRHDEVPYDHSCAVKFTEADRQQRIERRKLYYAMVENLDQNVGRLQRFLREQGLAENTIVVFLSDHGDLCGSHGLNSKEFPFETSIGIPLIVRDPRFPDQAGRVVTDVVCTEDLFPTLLDLVGLPVPADRPGVSLAPLIHGQSTGLEREGVLLQYVADFRAHHAFHDRRWRGYRDRRYKYTVLGGGEGARPWQLFDLRHDPHELHNLVHEPGHRETVQRYHRALEGALREAADDFPLASPESTGVST